MADSSALAGGLLTLSNRVIIACPGSNKPL